MAAGVSNCVWTNRDIASLADEKRHPAAQVLVLIGSSIAAGCRLRDASTLRPR
jgi:hypothetical protein